MGYVEGARRDFPDQALAEIKLGCVAVACCPRRIKAPDEPYDGRVADLTVAEFPEKFGRNLSTSHNCLSKLQGFHVQALHRLGVISVRGAVRLQVQFKDFPRRCVSRQARRSQSCWMTKVRLHRKDEPSTSSVSRRGAGSRQRHQ